MNLPTMKVVRLLSKDETILPRYFPELDKILKVVFKSLR